MIRIVKNKEFLMIRNEEKYFNYTGKFRGAIP